MHLIGLVATLASLLSLVQALVYHFDSAIYENVCKEKNGGYGPGRVTWRTRHAECTSTTTFMALCLRTMPNRNAGYTEYLERPCGDSTYVIYCFPAATSSMARGDVACRDLPPTVSGSKPPGDTDGIACSSGLKFDTSLLAWSTIVFTTPNTGLQGCWTQQSGDSSKTLNEHYPCDNDGGGYDANLLTFDKGVTYQTCIEANDDSPNRISWLWKITSPFGHYKRDGVIQKRILDLIEIDHSVATGGGDTKIVIVDEDGVETEL